VAGDALPTNINCLAGGEEKWLGSGQRKGVLDADLSEDGRKKERTRKKGCRVSPIPRGSRRGKLGPLEGASRQRGTAVKRVLPPAKLTYEEEGLVKVRAPREFAIEK